MHKYGRDFSIAVMENRERCVSDRVSTSFGLIVLSNFVVRDFRCGSGNEEAIG